MSGMFESTYVFNQPIGDWNTSSVTDMSSMFSSAQVFNQPIGDWDTSSVTDMNGMFGIASAFNQPIGDWDTSSVTDMESMFRYASVFNQNINPWCVSNITSKPNYFDSSAGFMDDATLQPKWGQCPVDSDGDGIIDSEDAFPLDATETVDTDGDGTGNNADTDDDGDGVEDTNDAFPLDTTEAVDTDGDGIGNNADSDDDGDGMSDAYETENGFNPLDSSDADGDADGDGYSNLEEYEAETDPQNANDFPVDTCHKIVILDHNQTDIWDSNCNSTHKTGSYAKYYTFTLSEKNTVTIDLKSTIDTYLYLLEGDSKDSNVRESDDDGGEEGYNSKIIKTLEAGIYTVEATTYYASREGIFDINITVVMLTDTDGDGIADTEDTDDDNDGVEDTEDAFPLDDTESVDTDGDGVGNNADSDDDDDGISDEDETTWGFDPLDASDGNDADADGDGVSNKDEIKAGSDPLDPDDTKRVNTLTPIITYILFQ